MIVKKPVKVPPVAGDYYGDIHADLVLHATIRRDLRELADELIKLIVMTVQFLEEYKSTDGRWFHIGEIAEIPEGEARILVRTGRAKEFRIKPPDPPDPPPDA